MAIDNRLQIFDENGNPVDYDIMATDVKFADGKDLPTKLDELENEIGESQGGYTPPTGGIPKTDLAPAVQQTLDDVANKVDKVTGKGLSTNDYTDTDKAKVDNLKPVATSGSYNDLTDKPTIPTVPTMDAAPTAGNTTHTVSSDGVAAAIAAASGGESVVINSDGANIVDSHTNPSILVAPSARQMYMAYQNINTLFNKVNDLYDKLAGIAFKDGKPANWKENANWLTPAIPTHTITLDTSSNVSASMNDTAISESVPATEGKVTIKLTPSQGAIILTENITIKLGTENVPFTTAADNGSILVTFILAGDVTFSASASSGRAISFTGTGCRIDDVGVPIGEDLDTTIRAEEHWTLPSSITVKFGNTDVTHTYTKAQDGKTAALHIDAANITGDLTITCSADEDAHVMLAISGSGFTISDGNKTYSNGDKVYNTAQVTLSIAPASGKKFTTMPSSDKGSMTNNGAYAASSLDIGTSVSGIVAISAETADLTNYSVGIQSIANFSVAYTDLSGNAIAAVNNVATVVENSGVKIRLTPTSNDYTLTVESMTMGGSPVTPSVTTDNGVTVITIEHVTGAVVVSATAAPAGQVTVDSTGSENATITDNGASEGGTLVLTIDPNAGYGFAAADSNDATDVFRGSIVVKDGNDNTIVDTANAIGLNKISCGAITPPTPYGTTWSRAADAAPTTVTIDNAPPEVSVIVKPAILLQRNVFVTASKTFARNQNNVSWKCVCPPVRLPLPTLCIEGSSFVYKSMTAGAQNLSSNQPPQLMISDSNTSGSYWGSGNNGPGDERSVTILASHDCVGHSHWAAVFDFDDISSCFFKFKHDANSEEVTVFDGSIKRSYIYVEDPTLQS